MVLKSASHLIAEGRAEAARGLLEEALAGLHGDEGAAVWLKYAHVLRLGGEEDRARDILAANVLKTRRPHVLDLIDAGIAVCKPMVFGPDPMTYFAVPKCGSSTFKIAILRKMGVEGRIVSPHVAAAGFERIMGFADFDRNFADSLSFLLIRHPRLRLRSYWLKNIGEEGSLAKEAQGKPSFYDLATRPDYNDMLRNFARYRQVFRDFRHHTNAILAFVGAASRARRVFDITELDDAVAALGVSAGFEAARDSRMQAKQRFDAADADAGLEAEVLKQYYADDIAAFGW